MHTLTIRVDRGTANYPEVRLLVDGDDLLAVDGNDRGNDPADILDTGALLPVDPPRRIAFYGCGCGEFGCANVAGLITRRGDLVEWSDFRNLTGVYHSALPDPDDGPDPVAFEESDLPSRPYRDLPTLTFDAEKYLGVVRSAMAARGWETRTRAVVRHVRELRPDLWLWAASDGDRITGLDADLTVPEGPPDRLAARLVALLDDGVGPQRIEQERLWR